MYRFFALIVGTSMTFAAFVGTGYAASSVRDALSERFKPSRIEMPRGSDEGSVVEKGTTTLTRADIATVTARIEQWLAVDSAS